MRESIRDMNEYFKTRERKEKTNRNTSSIRAGVSSSTRCTLLVVGFFGSEGKVGQALLR